MMLWKIWQWLLGMDADLTTDWHQWRFAFVGDYNNYVNLGLLAGFVLLVLLVVRNYRREGEASPRVKMSLAGIRVLVLVVVFAVLLQPALVRQDSHVLHRSVIVLIDDSLSMSLKDRYGDKETQRRLCNALSVSPEQLAELSRADIVRKMLGKQGGPLAKLAKDHPLTILGFSTASPGKETYTRRLLEVPVQEETREPVDRLVTESLGKLTGGGYSTNLAGAINDALDQTQGRRVAGVVIVSDGQDTSPQGNAERLLQVTRLARRRGLPLYSVVVGDPVEPRNLSVTALQGPGEIRKGSQAQFNAVLLHRNLNSQKVTVKLECRQNGDNNWKTLEVRKDVPLKASADSPAGGNVQSVSFDVTPEQEGQFVYRAVVVPAEGERDAEDNHAQAAVRVSDSLVRVLLISGDCSWEFQYLRNYLLRRPQAYRVSVWQQNLDKGLPQAGAKDMRLKSLPRKLSQLVSSSQATGDSGYDVIICIDPQVTDGGFDKEFAKLLEEFVTRHNGGLCYIAGTKFSDGVLLHEKRLQSLADILPVTLSVNEVDLSQRISRVKPQSWSTRLTTYGMEHPATRLGGDSEDTQRVWQMLAEMYWVHPVHRVKPGARVLAESGNLMQRTAKGKQLPVLAVHPIGSGRVVYLGTQETWRWRSLSGGRYYNRFWGNVISYLSTTQARRLVITTGGERFSAGQQIDVEVRVYDRFYKPLLADELPLELSNLMDKTAETVLLKPVDAKQQPGLYKGTIPARAIGEFELSAGKDLLREFSYESRKRFVVELPKGEMQHPQADPDRMQRIASKEAYFLNAWEMDRLAEIIPPGQLKISQETADDLWDCPLVLLLLVLLLAAEWIGRKKCNMA